MTDGNEYFTKWVTKREFIAAIVNVESDVISYKENVAIMGCEAPKDTLENIKWWVSAQAKYKVMMADALIKALNETKK